MSVCDAALIHDSSLSDHNTNIEQSKYYKINERVKEMKKNCCKCIASGTWCWTSRARTHSHSKKHLMASWANKLRHNYDAWTAKNRGVTQPIVLRWIQVVYFVVPLITNEFIVCLLRRVCLTIRGRSSVKVATAGSSLRQRRGCTIPLTHFSPIYIYSKEVCQFTITLDSSHEKLPEFRSIDCDLPFKEDLLLLPCSAANSFVVDNWSIRQKCMAFWYMLCAGNQ